MLVRKKWLFCLVAFLCLSTKAMAADSYKRLEADFSNLQSSKKSTSIEGWKKLQQRFSELASKNLSASDAASANFMAARCQNEISKRTHSFPDYRKAATDYGAVYKRYPKSKVASHALYQKAVIEVNPLGNIAEADSTLKTLSRLGLDSSDREKVSALQKEIEVRKKINSGSEKFAGAGKEGGSKSGTAEPLKGGAKGAAENSRKADSGGESGRKSEAVRLKSILVDAANTKSTVVINLSAKAECKHLLLSERKAAKGQKPGKILRLEFEGIVPNAGVLGTTPVSAGPLRSVTALKKDAFSNQKGVKGAPLTCVDLALAVEAEAKVVERGTSVKVFVGRSGKELASLLSRQKVFPSAGGGRGDFADDTPSYSGGANGKAAGGAKTRNADSDSGSSAGEDAFPATYPFFTPRQEEMADQLGLTVKNVLIDPGHGGQDPGAAGNSVVESKTVLKLAKMLEVKLRKKGYNVTYTRDRDVFIPLEKRTAIANRRKADLFISLHVNASPNSSASGIETYYLDKAKSKSAERVAARENGVKMGSTSDLQVILTDLGLSSKMRESRVLASKVLVSMTRQAKSSDYDAHSNGVRSAPFYVLVGAKMPSILVEIGYLSNKGEAKKLSEDAYLAKLADGIANGVALYKSNLVSSI